MNLPTGPALITLATSLLLFGCCAYVGRCRLRFGIPAPATGGHPQFEIAHRIHMNTLENAVAFLPVLWVCALAQSAAAATAVGAAWVLARVWYAFAYAAEPKRRGLPFLLSMLAFGALGLLAAWGVLRSWLAGL